MNGNEALHIICPSPKKGLAIAISCGGILVLGVALSRKGVELSLFLVVAPIMVALFLALLYRNLIYRQEICILRQGVKPGGAPFCVRTTEIIGVRRLPSPSKFSAEGKWASLGLADGPIEIETTTDKFRFGSGLSEFEIDATITRIDAFRALDRLPAQQ